MGTLTLYKGKNSPHRVAAYHEDTDLAMERKAHQIAGTARGILEAHHGRTRDRANRNPPPTIRVERGTLDWYVIMEAEGGYQRVMGIDLGHRYQSKEKNASGPWGQSNGLGVMDKAADIAVAGHGL